MHKLEALYSSNKGIPKVIKIYEDCENSKSKSSFKMSFWGSADLSPGVEISFNEMIKRLESVINMVFHSNHRRGGD
jgi:hypothetical protein